MPETTTTPQLGDLVTIITNGRRFDGGRVIRVSKTGAQVTFAKRDKLTGCDQLPEIARRHRSGHYYRKNQSIVRPTSEVVFERPAPPKTDNIGFEIGERTVREPYSRGGSSSGRYSTRRIVGSLLVETDITPEEILVHRRIIGRPTARHIAEYAERYGSHLMVREGDYLPIRSFPRNPETVAAEPWILDDSGHWPVLDPDHFAHRSKPRYSDHVIRLLQGGQDDLRKKIEKAQEDLAKLPENSLSHKAEHARGHIKNYPGLIAEIDDLLGVIAAANAEQNNE